MCTSSGYEWLRWGVWKALSPGRLVNWNVWGEFYLMEVPEKVMWLCELYSRFKATGGSVMFESKMIFPTFKSQQTSSIDDAKKPSSQLAKSEILWCFSVVSADISFCLSFRLKSFAGIISHRPDGKLCKTKNCFNFIQIRIIFTSD